MGDDRKSVPFFPPIFEAAGSGLVVRQLLNVAMVFGLF